MKMLLAIGMLGFAIAFAILLLVVRAVRRTRLNQDARRRGEEESHLKEEADRRAEQNTDLQAERQRSVKEADGKARLHAEQQARVAVELEARPSRATEEARQKAEEALRAAESEALRRAQKDFRRDEEARAAAEEEARAAAEQETQRRAQEEARQKADEVCRAAEAETLRRAEEESRREAEESARLHAEQQQESLVTKDEEAPPIEDEAGLKKKAEDEAHLAVSSPGLVGGTMAGVLAGPTIRDPESSSLKTPHQYRPMARVPTARAIPSARVSAPVEHDTQDRALPIGVRLVFEKAGFCRVSLLPRRAPWMPIESVVSGSGNPPELQALQDEWYQDILLPDAGRLLKEGVEWVAVLSRGQQVRWSLSGREIYVLARHDDLAGFVNLPRMVLGEQHVVLCVSERLQEVRSAIALTGSSEPMLLDTDIGVPAGWVGLRGVVPHIPIAPSTNGDILDALRPLPEVEISLEGGIRIDRQTWLSDFPPRIRLRGDTDAIVTIMIDGSEAALSHEGGYVSPGWDSLGDHSVWCTTGSRAYSIREGAVEWEPWDAYSWSLGEDVAQNADAHPAICGVLVRPPRRAHADGRAILVPASNPVLLGAVPGEIEFCTPRGDMRVGLCVGFPWFEPVWAIPGDALHRDKRYARILLIGTPRQVTPLKGQLSVPAGQHTRRARGPGVHEWCAAIRNAGRKGLQVEPPRSDLAELWKRYQHWAKVAWRSKR